ncbi:MAG: hypothetical protein KDI38_23495 [Calditrichaeota bacterium]|nr:hypothetical protein [Calditrichota bacterium]MCB9088500.1 hypothetical protein [Calditrichia bacterium]
MNSDKAQALLTHNAGILGQAVDSTVLSDAQQVYEVNSQWLAAAEKQNNTRAEGQAFKFSDKLVGYDYDAAFPTLLKNLLPVGYGILGFVLAAIFGAVVSSLASMLNSASTIATMDIYNKVKSSASQFELVTAGRVFTVLFVLIAILIAPNLDNPKFGGIFTFIQEFQGFISPGVLAIFLFGLLVHRTPRFAGTVGLLLNPVLYGTIKWGNLTGIGFLESLSTLSFLDRMAVCFFTVIAVLTVITLLKPLPKPVDLPVNEKMDISTSKSTKTFGYVVVALTLALYVIFW